MNKSSHRFTGIGLILFLILVMQTASAQTARWGYHSGYLLAHGQPLYERPDEQYKILLKWSVNYTGKTPVDMASGDIDFDRKTDLILALSDNSVIALDTQGSMTQAIVRGESDPREKIYDLNLRDVDGDNRPEIILA